MALDGLGVVDQISDEILGADVSHGLQLDQANLGRVQVFFGLNGCVGEDVDDVVVGVRRGRKVVEGHLFVELQDEVDGSFGAEAEGDGADGSGVAGS